MFRYKLELLIFIKTIQMYIEYIKSKRLLPCPAFIRPTT
jgi:hypothetical protein